MKPVKIYTTSWCPYCVRAKRLLDKKGVAYEEVDVEGDDETRARLVQQTGRRTVPQIFIGEHHVGGSDDLHDLEAQGKLDALLTG
jgi:glutaredoxin 3